MFNLLRDRYAGVRNLLSRYVKELERRYEARETINSYGRKVSEDIGKEVYQLKVGINAIIFHYGNKGSVKPLVRKLRRKGLDDILSWQPQPF